MQNNVVKNSMCVIYSVLVLTYHLSVTVCTRKLLSVEDLSGRKTKHLLYCCCVLFDALIGADFRFEVPGQSSVGLIGGGRGQWLGGHHGECGARAYNGVLGSEPPAGPKGRAPGQGVRGASPPLKLKAFWSLDVQRSRQI